MLKCFNLENFPFYIIHNCFAITSDNMYALNQVILSAFIKLKLYRASLIKLCKNLSSQIKSYGYNIIKKDRYKFLSGSEFDEPI